MKRHHKNGHSPVTSSVNSLSNPFDPEASISHGQLKSKPSGQPVETKEDIVDRAVEGAVMRAIFGGNDITRRNFLKLVGTTTATAVVSSIFPMEAAKAWAKDPGGPLEKKNLKIAFIPITCATPIIMAHPLGFYEKYGLKGTQVIKSAGWAMVRDWTVSKEVDCAHMLSPMPLAISLGAGAQPTPFCVPAIENINGQAITLHKKHKNVKTAKDMKGFTFLIPFDYSMHNFLLRYFLAEGGVDPDKDVKLRVTPPPEMVANLRAGNVDGYLTAEPFNQRAVYEDIGFLFKLSNSLWENHPCCTFSVSKEFATSMPNTFKAAFKAIVDATHFASQMENRKEIAKAIAPRRYLNQPREVVEQVLLGQFPDGLGNNVNMPGRIDFDPFPWQSMAIWMLTQMQRWGYIGNDINYKKIAKEVFLASDCANVMKELGYDAPKEVSRKHTIMGKVFDPDNPIEYLNSFDIRRT